MNKRNKIVSILIIVANLYFLPASIYNIYRGGGPMGFGYYLLPFTIIINLFLISAILSFKKGYENKVSIINNIGIIIIGLIIVSATLLIYFS